MKNNEKQFYLVDFQVLPEAIKKTIRIRIFEKWKGEDNK